MPLISLIAIKEDQSISKVSLWINKELKAAMVSLGFEAKSSTIFQMIADLDADGSGQLEFNEWLHLMTNRVSDKDSRESVDKIFALFDSDKAGAISFENLKKAAHDLGENIGDEELHEMFNRADTNGDGYVDADEFYTIVTRKIKDWCLYGSNLSYLNL